MVQKRLFVEKIKSMDYCSMILDVYGWFNHTRASIRSNSTLYSRSVSPVWSYIERNNEYPKNNQNRRAFLAYLWCFFFWFVFWTPYPWFVTLLHFKLTNSYDYTPCIWKQNWHDQTCPKKKNVLKKTELFQDAWQGWYNLQNETNERHFRQIWNVFVIISTPLPFEKELIGP